MRLGIIGANGFVGTAMGKLFPTASLFDIGARQSDINSCEAVFVCVPTNNYTDGSLDTSIVEEVVSKCTCPLILIRSTLNPGTADYLETRYCRNIVVVPEYAGETIAHPLVDEKTRPFLIIGGRAANRRKAIQIIQSVYNANVSIRQMSCYEAEVVKLSENRAIAFKVAQCQELYDACEAANIDYYAIRDAVYGDDPRFNLWHSFVYPDKRGLQSKCLPKDVYAWAAWAESIGASASLTRAILERNKEWVGAERATERCHSEL